MFSSEGRHGGGWRSKGRRKGGFVVEREKTVKDQAWKAKMEVDQKEKRSK